MKIDGDAVVQKLITQIANLHLQIAILQTEKEALQIQLKDELKKEKKG